MHEHRPDFAGKRLPDGSLRGIEIWPVEMWPVEMWPVEMWVLVCTDATHRVGVPAGACRILPLEGIGM